MYDTQKHMHSWVAIATWLVVFVISVAVLWEKAVLAEAIVWQLLFLLFMWLSTTEALPGFKPEWKGLAFGAMLLVWLILSWRIQVSFFFIYTIIWIAIAPHYLTMRNCWIWLLIINVAWFLVRAYSWQEQHALIETLLVGTFHIFALVSSTTALAASVANQRTQELNRELVATQHLLSEASKESERTRIARDLHDLLGHHLTALTINLQVASRLSNGEAREKVDQCHGLTKLLLSDVREAVSTLRETPTLDLQELLSLAIRDIPGLTIELDIDETLKLEDVNIAEVLLRCVQEAVTNTLRHGKARNMQVRVVGGDHHLQMYIRDDGQGSAEIVPGNGLRGMRERVERLGGSLACAGGAGFEITIDIPVPGEA